MSQIRCGWTAICRNRTAPVFRPRHILWRGCVRPGFGAGRFFCAPPSIVFPPARNGAVLGNNIPSPFIICSIWNPRGRSGLQDLLGGSSEFSDFGDKEHLLKHYKVSLANTMLIPLNRFYLAGQAGSADKTVRCQRSTFFGGKEMIKSEYRRLTDAAQRQKGKEKLLKKIPCNFRK